MGKLVASSGGSRGADNCRHGPIANLFRCLDNQVHAETATMEKNDLAINNLNATVQLTTVQVKDVPKDGKALLAHGGKTTISWLTRKPLALECP